MGNNKPVESAPTFRGQIFNWFRMAPKNPQKLGMEKLAVVFALLLFLFQLVLAMFGVQSFWLGVSFELAIIVLLVYAIWAWEGTHGFGYLTKCLSSLVIVVVVILILWKPAKNQYRREHPMPIAVPTTLPPITLPLPASPEINVYQEEIGWQDSQERLLVGTTSKSQPNRRWVANVHYKSATNSYTAIIYTAALIKPVPADGDQRNRVEDEIWNQNLDAVKRNKATLFQVVAQQPTFNSLDGPVLDVRSLRDLAEHKATVYFVAVFLDRDGITPRHGVCLFREGESPAVHHCHQYNGQL